jgi:hypothetical protein
LYVFPNNLGPVACVCNVDKDGRSICHVTKPALVGGDIAGGLVVAILVVARRRADTDVGELEPKILLLIASNGAIYPNDILNVVFDEEVV